MQGLAQTVDSPFFDFEAAVRVTQEFLEFLFDDFFNEGLDFLQLKSCHK